MQWLIADGLTNYEAAVSTMEQRVSAIRDNREDELLWFVEHPPLYTAGTSAKAEDLLAPKRLPIHQTGRGGQYTYHGPGQRVGYVMLDLKRRAERQGDKPDIRVFVKQLEQWLINTLAHFDIKGELREDRIGVWVQVGNTEKKIGALGIRVRQWVTFHGIALNINPDLSHFDGIVPCGISQYGVTSLHDLGVTVTMNDVDAILKAEFDRIFQ